MEFHPASARGSGDVFIVCFIFFPRGLLETRLLPKWNIEKKGAKQTKDRQKDDVALQAGDSPLHSASMLQLECSPLCRF